jgi:hypothetical protein
MTKTRYGLILSSVCCLISASVGTLLAVRAHLPANFAGLLHGYDVVNDFLTWRGTALSAPFSLLFIQLVLTIGVLSSGWIEKAGVVGLTILGVCYIIGQLGEPIVEQAFNALTSNLLPALIIITNILTAIIMMVFGIIEWRSSKI